jgi:hypothetical protein
VEAWVGNQAARGAVSGEIEIGLQTFLFFFKSLTVSGIDPNARVGL